MDCIKIKEDFYYIGCQDPELRVFDIIMETKYGTTYNSYLLKSEAGVVLFESVKEKHFDEYLEKIKKIVAIEEITYLVCSHTEPDHSGSIARLLDLNPNITIVSSMIANMYLKEILNCDFTSKIMKESEVLDLHNKHVRFISVPNLHWPDSMYSYIEEDKLLVTCDSFGAHYACDEIVLSKVKDVQAYEEAFTYYTTMIMGPFKKFVASAMEKIKGLDITFIATGHGPLIDCQIKETIQKYKEFCIEEKPKQKRVVIPYVSAYGYTKKMANAIQCVLIENNIVCTMYDLVESDKNKVIQDMIAADGIIYGCPTLLNDALPPIYEVMNAIIPAYHGVKVVSAFGSYGWSGEALSNMIARLQQQKMKVVEGIRIKFNPSEQQLNEVKQFALTFIEQL